MSSKAQRAFELQLVGTSNSVEHESLSRMVVDLAGKTIAYYETLPKKSSERAELVMYVMMLQDAHSDLTQAMHRIKRTCMFLDGVLNPEADDDED